MRKLTKEIQAPDHSAAVAEMLALLQDPDPAVGVIRSLDEVAAVGFKVVGARGVTGAVRLDEPVLRAMEEYNPVLPAHNPPYLAAIRIFERLVPAIPRIGLFETTFHRDIPDYAWIYSVPYEWYEKYGVRRYGYHGASLRYVSERVPALLGRPAAGLRLVACHLGGSSSVCAVKDGRSIDTSMGLTTQAGVPMSSRSGDFDPFVIPFIQEREGLTPAGVGRALTTNGGLKGISGVSGDVRDLEEAAAAGNDRARLALDAFAYDVKKYIGAYAAAMGGLDAIAFAGGIGENGVEMRAQYLRGTRVPGRGAGRGAQQGGPARGSGHLARRGADGRARGPHERGDRRGPCVRGRPDRAGMGVARGILAQSGSRVPVDRPIPQPLDPRHLRRDRRGEATVGRDEGDAKLGGREDPVSVRPREAVVSAEREQIFIGRRSHRHRPEPGQGPDLGLDLFPGDPPAPRSSGQCAADLERERRRGHGAETAGDDVGAQRQGVLPQTLVVEDRREDDATVDGDDCGLEWHARHGAGPPTRGLRPSTPGGTARSRTRAATA